MSCTQKTPGSSVARNSEVQEQKAETSSTVDAGRGFGIDSLTYHLQFYPVGSYVNCKSAGIKERDRLCLEYIQASDDSVKMDILKKAGDALTNQIVNRLMPFWYQTPWTFEGHTDVPGVGTIACGYLVSTTLKHAGFNLNRYKLAQKAGMSEAKSLTLGEEVKVLRNCTRTAVKDYFLQHKPDGLYFVGLDIHVGYLLKRNGELFFIHSNYINREGVVIEVAEQSRAFSSKLYCFADISSSPSLIKCWLNRTEIKIVD